jgi:hypothetical protein
MGMNCSYSHTRYGTQNPVKNHSDPNLPHFESESVPDRNKINSPRSSPSQISRPERTLERSTSSPPSRSIQAIFRTRSSWGGDWWR